MNDQPCVFIPQQYKYEHISSGQGLLHFQLNERDKGIVEMFLSIFSNISSEFLHYCLILFCSVAEISVIANQYGKYTNTGIYLQQVMSK